MTTAVRELIESFERMSDAERTEAVVEILRRSPNAVSPPLEDDEFPAFHVTSENSRTHCRPINPSASPGALVRISQ